jgi:molybdenum cofactor biosynthesis protein B
MGVTTERHRAEAPGKLKAGVITISDSKYDYLWSKNKSLEEAEDASGRLITNKLREKGHEVVFYTIIPDHEGLIVETIDYIASTYAPDIIITTGGTGVAKRDVTIEALESIFDKSIEGFGELFRKVSFERLGSAALLSRATAGVCGGVVIFALPGSPDAVETGMQLVLKEAGHIVKHVRE